MPLIASHDTSLWLAGGVRLVIPKVCYSEGSLFRTYKFRIPEGSLIRNEIGFVNPNIS